MMSSKKQIVVVFVGWLIQVSCVRAEPNVPGEIVYDSANNPIGGGFAIPSLDIGQAVRLEGTAREIIRIDVLLGASQAEEFSIRFYSLDDALGMPSELIWESPNLSYPYTPPFFNRKLISVAVPRILVPDEFVWTASQNTPSPSNFMVVTGTITPTVGSHINYWRRSLDGDWQSNLFSSGTFAARLVAVPEPSALSIGLLCLVSTYILRRRSRLRSITSLLQ